MTTRVPTLPLTGGSLHGFLLMPFLLICIKGDVASAGTIDFSLQNVTNNQLYTSKNLQGLPLVFIFGERKGQKSMICWEKYLKNVIGNDSARIKVLPIAILRIPPFIPRSFIRGKIMSQNPPASLLLDWGGVVAEKCKTDKSDPLTILILDSLHREIARFASGCDSGQVSPISLRIDGILHHIISTEIH
jgi:hypothetical protein